MRVLALSVLVVTLCAGARTGIGAQAVPTEQRFALVLPEVSATAMMGGGVVRLPSTKVSRLYFVIGAPASRRIDPGAISVELNQVRLEPKATTGTELSVAVTLQPGDWRSDSPNEIAIRVRGSRDYANTWIVEHAQGLTMTETVGDDQGVPVEITLRQPRLPIIAPASGTASIILHGGVNRSEGTLTVNGQPVALVAAKDGISSEFRLPLTVTRDVSEVVVEARGKAGDYSRLIFPIRWPR